MPQKERTRYYPAVRPAIPHRWKSSSRVTHPFATGPELPPIPYDLHVLSTPPAFVLSQDQTLRKDVQPLPTPRAGADRFHLLKSSVELDSSGGSAPSKEDVSAGCVNSDLRVL